MARYADSTDPVGDRQMANAGAALGADHGSVPGSSVTGSLASNQTRVSMRSEHGISKPKSYTDSTIRYSF
jgi:hypothetical protein